MYAENHPIVLDDRLRTAFDFVRQDAIIADIGTDHAYLPAALLLEGRVSYAIAADINAGPLVHAANTVSRYGLEDRLHLYQTDGLQGLSDKGLTDILIYGMGGELIVSILSAADFVRTPTIRLILQPMTRKRELRLWLVREGFRIVGETLSRAADKCYQTICAEYCGEASELTELEAEFGPHNLAQGGPLLAEIMERRAAALRARIEGRRSVGLASEEDEVFLREIYAYMQSKGEKNNDCK